MSGLDRERRSWRSYWGEVKLSYFKFSVRQWTGKADWLFKFGLSITESGKYVSCLVQQMVTFLNEFIHSVNMFKTIILSKDKTHNKNDKTKFSKN